MSMLEVTSLESPFAGAANFADNEAQFTEAPIAVGESPFAESMLFTDEADMNRQAVEALGAELEDAAFDESVQALVQEVAGRHLMSAASWSSQTEAYSLASGDVEAWVGSIGREADRLFEAFESEFGTTPLLSLAEGEVESAGERYLAGQSGLDAATEQFLGSVFRKIGSVVSKVRDVVHKGISLAGKFLPMNWLLDRFRKFVKPLLKGVLAKGIRYLPAAVQPIARQLAARLTGEYEAPLFESYHLDAALAEALVTGSDSAVNELLAASESMSDTPEAADPLGALDAARQRLAGELRDMSRGEMPIAEVEQFIPVVMAAMPLIRLGVKALGRDRVVKAIAGPLASLIKPFVGDQAARALAGPIVNVGLKSLSLEQEANTSLGSEAVVSTLEDTIRSVASLPAESLEEPRRIEAEVQEAFAEAAARFMPRNVLRSDLDTFETEDEGGTWVLMPRSARPCYRYRKCTKVYRVPISRPMARAIILTDGETLEERLLDAGAESWPVSSEVHLYEAIPGTQLGHLAAFEDSEVGEFEDLTTQAASLLTGQPGLGRPASQLPSTGMAVPGRRYFRVRVPGMQMRRGRGNVSVRASLLGARPTLRVHVRISERLAHAIRALSPVRPRRRS